MTPLRDYSFYRRFREADLHRLAFLGRARSLGVSIEDCRGLLELQKHRLRASADVKEIACGHLERINEKLAEVTAMRQTLSHLVACRAGATGPIARFSMTSMGRKTFRNERQ